MRLSNGNFAARPSGHGNGCQAIEIAGAPLNRLVLMRIENSGIPKDLPGSIRKFDLADFAIFNGRSSRENNALPQFRCYLDAFAASSTECTTIQALMIPFWSRSRS